MEQKRSLVAAGLLVGVVGNIMLRSPQGPGVSMFLFFLTLAVSIGLATRAAGRAPSREAWTWIAGGVLLSSAFVVRGSPNLQFIAFLGAAAALAFPALKAGAAWMRGSGVSDHLEAVGGAMGFAGLGALRLAADALRADSVDPDAEPSGRPGVPAVLRGFLLAAPLLFIFGALFVGADPVFEDLVTSLLGTAMDEWLGHVLLTGIIAWLATGYLTGFLTGTRMRDLIQVRMRRPSLGIVELGIALGLVCVLFTAFIAVQFRYLFGGAGLVEVTPGLTYAEYAREGFGQLALASALVIPALLASDWLLGRPGSRARAVFRTLGWTQLILLALVIVSAFQRVRAYQEAYGLTEFRFYGVAFLGWLTLVGAWFGASVLRGRRERFASPALLSGYALVALLLIANPDAWIARTNLERSEAAPASDTSIDIDYLGSLSADAVPTLLEALPTLSPETRCRLAGDLLNRWDTDRDSDWRSWNLANARARARVRAEGAVLEGMVLEGSGAGSGTDAGCDGDRP